MKKSGLGLLGFFFVAASVAGDYPKVYDNINHSDLKPMIVYAKSPTLTVALTNPAYVVHSCNTYYSAPAVVSYEAKIADYTDTIRLINLNITSTKMNCPEQARKVELTSSDFTLNLEPSYKDGVYELEFFVPAGFTVLFVSPEARMKVYSLTFLAAFSVIASAGDPPQVYDLHQTWRSLSITARDPQVTLRLVKKSHLVRDCNDYSLAARFVQFTEDAAPGARETRRKNSMIEGSILQTRIYCPGEERIVKLESDWMTVPLGTDPYEEQTYSVELIIPAGMEVDVQGPN